MHTSIGRIFALEPSPSNLPQFKHLVTECLTTNIESIKDNPHPLEAQIDLRGANNIKEFLEEIKTLDSRHLILNRMVDRFLPENLFKDITLDGSTRTDNEMHQHLFEGMKIIYNAKTVVEHLESNNPVLFNAMVDFTVRDGSKPMMPLFIKEFFTEVLNNQLEALSCLPKTKLIKFNEKGSNYSAPLVK